MKIKSLVLLIPCLVIGLIHCGGLGSLGTTLNFTDQDIQELLDLARESRCPYIDTEELRDLIEEVGDEAEEVFGISKEEAVNLINEYENEDHSSLCIIHAKVNEGTTHKAFFFTVDDSFNTSQWRTEDLQITETASDGTQQIFTPESVVGFSNYTNDVVNTTFSFGSVLDYSGSMSDEDLLLLEEGLSFLYQNLPDNFRSEVIKFSSDVETFQSYTDDNNILLSAVENQEISRGSTALYDGIYQGLSDTALESNELRFVVTFTDGLENSSSYSKDEVMSLAQSNDIPLINIGMGGLVDITLLLEISNQTGGFFFYASDNDTLETVFNLINETLTNTHVVTWTSSSTDLSSVTITAGSYTGSLTF